MQTGMGKAIVEEFIDSLDGKMQKKVMFVLQLAEADGIIPVQYFKHLENSDGIYEFRVQSGGEIVRLLCFWGIGNTLVLTHGFKKKTQKTPKSEIEFAQRWKRIYLQTKAKQ